VKATRQSVARLVEQPNPGTRFYLLHGPDDAQSRALGGRLVEALGASRFLVSGGTIKGDPAALADEAGAMSLFGGVRVVWIEPAGEEIVAGVEALLEAPAPESPVIAISGALRKTSALLKLAEASPAALAFAAYAPEGADASRMVSEVGRKLGLKIGGAVAGRIANSCSNDQALVSQELQKFALYADASPHNPRELDEAVLDAVGADNSEGNVLRLADMALGGDVGGLSEELAALRPGSSDAIPVVRSLQRRLLMLAPIRARVDRGERPDAVLTSLGKSLFFKERDIVGRLLTLWDSRGLAAVADRARRLEHELLFSPVPEREALGEALLAIARKARSR
jgi:DNA polymerase-3 subunit delta